MFNKVKIFLLIISICSVSSHLLANDSQVNIRLHPLNMAIGEFSGDIGYFLTPNILVGLTGAYGDTKIMGVNLLDMDSKGYEMGILGSYLNQGDKPIWSWYLASKLLISSYTSYIVTNSMDTTNIESNKKPTEKLKINNKLLMWNLIGGIRYKWTNGFTLHLGLGTKWFYILQRSLNNEELSTTNLDKKWNYYPVFDVGLGWLFGL